jgi:GNAT superfamily N-acetyltransferase
LDRARLDQDIRRINEMGDLVRSSGWGFVPFTPAELDHVVAQLKRILQPELNYIAEIHGEPVGYLMSMPDLNWALQRSFGRWDWVRLPQVLYWLRRARRLRIFGLGILPKYRHSGLAGLLIKRLFDDCGAKYRAWELSWIDSENVRSIRSVQGFIPIEVYKKYHLYQRRIDSASPLYGQGMHGEGADRTEQ